MEREYKDYYEDCLNKGLKFQDFIATVLLKELGIPLSSFYSKNFQFKVGENLQGIEIKFDDMYKKTGNLYIEVKEKADPKNYYYVKSGIFRNDNTWLYIIGDYENIFIFGKSHLQLMYKSSNYREVTTATSVGFLIGNEEAKKYALKYINYKE